MTQPGCAQWALARSRQADEAAAALEDCSPPRANAAAGGRMEAQLQGSAGRGAAGARRADERSDGHGGAGGRTERGGAAGTFNPFGEGAQRSTASLGWAAYKKGIPGAIGANRNPIAAPKTVGTCDRFLAEKGVAHSVPNVRGSG